jgi:hypothetical protein
LRLNVKRDDVLFPLLRKLLDLGGHGESR